MADEGIQSGADDAGLPDGPADYVLDDRDARHLLGPDGVFHAVANRPGRPRMGVGALLALLAFQAAVVVLLIYRLM